MKAGDIYYVDKEKSIFDCSFIMRIKKIRHDTIFFDRIVFPKSGKIYYDVKLKNLSAPAFSIIYQWGIEKFSRKRWYILIRRLNNE